MTTRNAIRPLLFGLLVGLSAASSGAQETQTPANDASPSQAAEQGSAAIAEMAPPKPPKVTCAGDQLTIIAINSTLGSVLAAVHDCTGVQVDIPSGAVGSRVFEELGPGPE